MTEIRSSANPFETDRIGKREADSPASKKPESELVCRTLGEVGQRRMSVEADPGWRVFAAASLAAIYRTLSRGAQPSGQRQSDLVSFAAGGKKGHGSSAVSRTTGRPAEVLREASGIKVGGTGGDGLTRAHIVRMRGISPGKRPSAPDLSSTGNELLLRAVTGTSFFTIRVSRP